MSVIQVENDGPEIISTNFWDSEYAENGYVFLSINAGCFRLLVPSMALNDALWDASKVLITRGPFPAQGRNDTLEILFEDGTESPFCFFIGTNQVDRMPLDSDRDSPGRPPKWSFSLYTDAGKHFSLPARYRLAKKIPHLKPWIEQ